VFRSDCNVAFLGPEGGSFAFWVNDEGQEIVRLDFGAWVPLAAVDLVPWQREALELVMEAIEQM
jgi:hypothetical protein